MKPGAALRRAAFLAVLVAIAGVLALVRGGDGSPPDDADLMAETPAPADHANAFLTLTSAAALLAWPLEAPEEARWLELARGETWDAALAESALAGNERALTAFARAARQTQFRSPQREAHRDAIAWIDLARLQGMRAIALARAGSGELAVSEALVSLRVARVVGADSNGSTTVAAVAITMAGAGLDALRAVLAAVALTPEQSGQLAGELAALRTDPASWRALLAAEYRGLAPRLPESGVPVTVPDGHGGLTWLAWILPDSHLYQPDNTRAAYAESIRRRMNAAGEPCAASEQPPFEVTVRSLLAPNAAGRQLIELVGVPVAVDRFRCRFDTQVDALRAAIAVQVFERERGVLPPSLEALVPDYLSEAPRDWLGEGALRLDRSAREIVSVGLWDSEPAAAAREERFALLPAHGA